MGEAEKVYRMTQTEGWAIVRQFIEKQIETCARRLTEERFTELQEVARIQGEVLAYRRVLSFVNNRCDKIREGVG